MSQTEIKIHLADSPNGLTVKHLMNLTGLSDGTIRDQLNSLEKWGDVESNCSSRPHIYRLSKKKGGRR